MQAPDATLTVHDRDQLERGFRRLTPEQRAVLVFHHYLGLPMPRCRIALVSRSAPPSPASLRNRGHAGRPRGRCPLARQLQGASRMSATRDPDALIAAYLAEGVDELPESGARRGPSRHPPDASARRGRPAPSPRLPSRRARCGRDRRRAGYRDRGRVPATDPGTDGRSEPDAIRNGGRASADDRSFGRAIRCCSDRLHVAALRLHRHRPRGLDRGPAVLRWNGVTAPGPDAEVDKFGGQGKDHGECVRRTGPR